MYDYLLHVLAFHPYAVYLLILVLAFAEGPFLSLTSGALLYAGFFSFWPIYFVLMLGDLIGDVFLYYLGYRYGHNFAVKFGKYLKLTEAHIEKAKELFHKHKNWILLFSKTTNGLGFAVAVLFTAGMSKIPFWRYIGINILGQLIWSGMLIALGYFFSHAYVQINNTLGKVTLVLGGIIALLLFIKYIKYIRSRIEA